MNSAAASEIEGMVHYGKRKLVRFFPTNKEEPLPPHASYKSMTDIDIQITVFTKHKLPRHRAMVICGVVQPVDDSGRIVSVVASQNEGRLH